MVLGSLRESDIQPMKTQKPELLVDCTSGSSKMRAFRDS
jgi:hypothetical protein